MMLLPEKIRLTLINFKNTYPRLFTGFVVTALLFTITGITLYFKTSKLTENEIEINLTENEITPEYFEGRVSYVGDMGDGIFYALKDENGNYTVLLKSADEKLQLVEGLYAKVFGDFIRGKKSTGGGNGANIVTGMETKDILVVKEVILQNGSN